MANTPFTNTGHGHVWERPDKVKMRCGGLALCKNCRDDAIHMSQMNPAIVAKHIAEQNTPVERRRSDWDALWQATIDLCEQPVTLEDELTRELQTMSDAPLVTHDDARTIARNLIMLGYSK